MCLKCGIIYIWRGAIALPKISDTLVAVPDTHYYSGCFYVIIYILRALGSLNHPNMSLGGLFLCLNYGIISMRKQYNGTGVVTTLYYGYIFCITRFEVNCCDGCLFFYLYKCQTRVNLVINNDTSLQS